MVPLTSTDLIIALEKATEQTENKTTRAERVGPGGGGGSTHVHPLGGVDEAHHPGADVQLQTDHWDQAKEPDTLDHFRPPRQLYPLNSQNLAEDHRSVRKFVRVREEYLGLHI